MLSMRTVLEELTYLGTGSLWGYSGAEEEGKLQCKQPSKQYCHIVCVTIDRI
jgi:hypothetical protein